MLLHYLYPTHMLLLHATIGLAVAAVAAVGTAAVGTAAECVVGLLATVPTRTVGACVTHLLNGVLMGTERRAKLRMTQSCR